MTGRLGAFRAARLASQLPPEGAVGRAAGSEGFGLTDYLLLDVIDVLRLANWQRACENRPRAKWPPLPEPTPRPGAQTKPKKTITAAALLAFQYRHERR